MLYGVTCQGTAEMIKSFDVNVILNHRLTGQGSKQ